MELLSPKNPSPKQIPASESRILTITDLSVGFASKEILRIDDFAVDQGEVVAMIGRSGCGKTTLLRCLAGDLAPYAGTFSLNGVELGDGLPNGYVSRTLQSFPLFHWLTVRENLALAARLRRVNPTPDFDEVLRAFSASHLSNRYPQRLSGGEKCRASLCQAVITSPGLLLLDEPFTGLDSLVKQAIAEELFGYVRRKNAAAVFVTHDLHDAIDLADRIIVLGGRPATIAAVLESENSSFEQVRSLMKDAL